MRHALYVYDRRAGGATVHWKAGCALGFGGHRDRLYEFDRRHPVLAHLIDEPPEVVIGAMVRLFDGAVCVHCVPVPVLERLGLERPPGARAGTVLIRPATS